MKRLGVSRLGLGIWTTAASLFILHAAPNLGDRFPRLDTPHAAASDGLALGQPLKASSSIYVDVDASRHALNPSLALSNSVPYLAWIELNSHGVPQIYVRHWNGSAWIQDGPSQNIDTAYRAYDLSMSSDGKTPYLAWIELNGKETPQLHVKHLDKDQWIADGGSLNLDPAHGAADPALAVAESAPYLAWSELNSQRVFQLYASRLSKEGWRTVGEGSLNLDPTHDAIEPAIALQESVPYVAWMEPSDQRFYQIYVKRWNGSGWQLLGRSLNTDPTNHAMNPSITLLDRIPYVAWTEIDGNGISQLYVKRWNDDAWISEGPSLNLDSGRHAMSPSLMRIGSTLYAAWTEYDSKGTSQVHIKHWTGQRWELDDPDLKTAPVTVAASPRLAASGTTAYMAWKEIDQNGLFHIVAKSLQTK